MPSTAGTPVSQSCYGNIFSHCNALPNLFSLVEALSIRPLDANLDWMALSYVWGPVAPGAHSLWSLHAVRYAELFHGIAPPATSVQEPHRLDRCTLYRPRQHCRSAKPVTAYGRRVLNRGHDGGVLRRGNRLVGRTYEHYKKAATYSAIPVNPYIRASLRPLHMVYFTLSLLPWDLLVIIPTLLKYREERNTDVAQRGASEGALD